MPKRKSPRAFWLLIALAVVVVAAIVASTGRKRRMESKRNEAGVLRDDLEALASAAAKQWTGTFNPRPFDATAALELYERAF